MANKTTITTKFKNSTQREIFNFGNYPKNVNCHSKIASCEVKINPPRGPTACGLLFGEKKYRVILTQTQVSDGFASNQSTTRV